MGVSFDEKKLEKEVSKLVYTTILQGSAQLCGRVSSRLHALFEILRATDAVRRGRVAATFATALAEFLYALRLQNQFNFVLYRVATSQRLVAQVCQAHRCVDEIYEELGVKEEEELAQWRTKLADDRAQQER